MGLIIKTELETNIGSTDCAYVSIESYTVRKNTGQISFAISYYTNEEYVKESLPKYTEDIANILSISNDAKFTPHSVLCLKDKEWIEVSLPQNLKANFSKPIKTPIFDTKEVIKEVIKILSTLIESNLSLYLESDIVISPIKLST